MQTNELRRAVPSSDAAIFMRWLNPRLIVFSIAFVFLLIGPTQFSVAAKADKRKSTRTTHAASRQLTREELKEARSRLAEMGYGAGQTALPAFQKYEGREVTGRLTREDFDVLMSANPPQARESGYKHVEVDIDRQVLLLTNEEGAVTRVLPVSSGSDKQYKEKRASGLAYTPRGRFRIYSKIAGWRESPLGLLYYPSYFSGGVAIHGNPSVPSTPESHGCVRIPMSAAIEVSKQLPVGTIVLIYDRRGFVSAKDWAEMDRAQSARVP